MRSSRTPGAYDLPRLNEMGAASTETVPVPQRGFFAAYQRARHDLSLRRETDVMGLTVSVALLAALSAGNDFVPHAKWDVLWVVWGTTLGLSITHWFALLVSSRLVEDDRGTRYRPLELLISQTAMATVVALCASVVVLLLSADYDRLGARITAALFMGSLVVVESRAGGRSTSRALGIGGVVVVIGLAISIVKWFASK